MNVLNPLQFESGRLITRPNSLIDHNLRARINLLDEDDRLMLELAQNHHLTHRKIGQLMHLEPGTVSRRLRRIWQRVGHPIVERLMDPRCSLSGEYRQIGVEHFLLARPAPRIAAEHGLTPPAVRQIIDVITIWHRTTRPGARDAGES